MATLQVHFFKWRNGRPRWEPGPGLRAKGWRGIDLKDPQGRWLDEGAALARARELNAEVAAWRARGMPRRRQPAPRESTTTCAALWHAYTRTPEWGMLAAVTRRDYRSKASIWLEKFGDIEVAAVGKPHMRALWRSVHDARGFAMACGVLAVARAALGWACLEEWISINPAGGLKLPRPPPRCVVWTPSEIEALLAAADTLGLHGVGDAVVIALHTGQRQGDVLALEMPQTVNGRTLFRQSKTRARVSVPLTPQLDQRLGAIRQRRRAPGPVVQLLDARVVLRPDARPYEASSFGRDWRAVRARAARHLKACGEKHFLDLRDTAVTRLALAGCTVPEIRAITGHSMQTVHKVLEHYLALDDRMADSAISRLRAWMDEQGIAV